MTLKPTTKKGLTMKKISLALSICVIALAVFAASAWAGGCDCDSKTEKWQKYVPCRPMVYKTSPQKASSDCDCKETRPDDCDEECVDKGDRPNPCRVDCRRDCDYDCGWRYLTNCGKPKGRVCREGTYHVNCYPHCDDGNWGRLCVLEKAAADGRAPEVKKEKKDCRCRPVSCVRRHERCCPTLAVGPFDVVTYVSRIPKEGQEP